MTTGYTNILERGNKLKKLLAVSATALVVGTLAAAPAWAQVNNPHTVTVFPNRDMVGAEGYEANQPIRVQVLRNGVPIGDTGQVTTMPLDAGGFGLEVNHGAEPAGPGDCWVNSTPDIQGGDEVQVTTGTGANAVVETMAVADIGIDAASPTSNANGDVVIQGFARNDAGGPLDLADLTPEALHVDRNANPVRYRPDASTFAFVTGADWQATWANNGTNDIARLQEAGFSLAHLGGIGNDVTIAETGENGGPGPGCEAAPAAVTSIASISRDLINISNVGQDITVSGPAAADITGVSVAFNGKTYPATPANGTWSTTLPAADLADPVAGQPGGLGQGNHNLTATFTSNQNTAPQPQTRVIRKDTVAPGLATAGGTQPGIYPGARTMTLGSPEANSKIHFTRDGSTPTLGSPVYLGQELTIDSTQTIKAAVEDASGNLGNVATFEYTIDRVAPSLSASLNTGSFDTAQMLSFTSDDPNAEIRYTTNGSTPNRSSNLYTGPIRVSSTQTVRAIAYDAAGNSSMQSRTITIRTASTTTLNVPTTNLKLGTSRTIAGGVSPNNAGGFVRVTIDRPGTLSTINRNVSLSAFSRFSTVYRPTAVGTYRITASFAKDADNLGSTSVMKSFKVIR